MTSLNDLLKKSKQADKKNETLPTSETNKNSKNPQPQQKSTGFKINIKTPSKTDNSVQTVSKTQNILSDSSRGNFSDFTDSPTKSLDTPLSKLADTLSKQADISPHTENLLGLKTTIENAKTPQTNNEISTNSQSSETSIQDTTVNPTLDDIANFVFDEQPNFSNEAITDKFLSMLSNLASAMGSEIPTNLSKILKFTREHPFLVDMLKPEGDAILVNAMRKSYGYVINTQSEKVVKRTKNKEKQSAVMDSLQGLDIKL